jgi:hypothetical protein
VNLLSGETGNVGIRIESIPSIIPPTEDQTFNFTVQVFDPRNKTYHAANTSTFFVTLKHSCQR